MVVSCNAIHVQIPVDSPSSSIASPINNSPHIASFQWPSSPVTRSRHPPPRSDDRGRLLERYDDHRFVTAPRDGHILTVHGSWSYSGRNALEIMSCFDIDFAWSFCVWPDDQDPIEDSCSRTWISIFYNKCNGGILGGRLGGDMMLNKALINAFIYCQRLIKSDTD